jgi:hypothetical protein
MIKVPISNGELLDKITILQIKREKIKDAEKQKHIIRELEELTIIMKTLPMNEIDILFAELKKINTQLWEVEDALRDKERTATFDNEFIQLARKVYFTNDKRSQVKLKINKISKSELVEVKSYEKY